MSIDRPEPGAEPGVLCLQGGRELTPDCREMDRAVLEASGTRVAVLAGAARRGDDYAGAAERARIHYGALGARVRVVPDPRDDRPAALSALRDGADLLVLPGGSPASLLDSITGSVGELVVELFRAGTGISGSSAGAMVLCARTVVPGRDGTSPGLGLAPGLAVPHWSPGAERRWALDESEDLLLWGLPECGGVLIGDGWMRAIGRGHPAVRHRGSWATVPRDRSQPVPSDGPG